MPYLSAPKAMLAKWKLKLGLATPRTPSRTSPAPSCRPEEGQIYASLGASNLAGGETTRSDWNWFQPARESKERAMK